MVVFLFVVRRVLMLMGTMFPGMLMIVHMDIGGMLMRVGMFVKVLMGVVVRVLVGVNHISMLVFMIVYMGVFVGMQMFVLVGAFHHHPSL